MIVVDASALLAILFKETEEGAFSATLVDAGGGVISPVNLWEALVRAETALGAQGREDVERLLQALNIGVEPITGAQARLAADAHERFGRRTPAKLNLGDCFAYALAVEQGDRLLLFKGEDFGKTDVVRAG